MSTERIAEPGAKEEAVEVGVSSSAPTGAAARSRTPSGPNPTATTVNGPMRISRTPRWSFHGPRHEGTGWSCGYGDFDPDVIVKSAEKWTGGSLVSGTHTKLDVDTMGGLDVDNPVGDVTGTSTGSYPGLVSGTLNLTAGSVDDYNDVCKRGGRDLLLFAWQFDASTSTITIGGS